MFERCRLLAGVFVLLQVYAFLQYLKNRLTRHEFQTLFFLGVSVAAGVVFLSVIYLTYTGWCPEGSWNSLKHTHKHTHSKNPLRKWLC